MCLAYFHGEGILFSFLIHGFFVFVGSAALIFGLLKYKSKVGAYVAIGYVGLIGVCVFISHQFNNPLTESITTLLTLPWSLVLPCYNLDDSCPLSPAVSFICAELNAAVIYFLIAIRTGRSMS
jgi:hypothetical protein